MWCVLNTWWSVAELAPHPASLPHILQAFTLVRPSPPSFLTRNTGHALESQCPHGSLLQAPWSWRCPLPPPSPVNILPLPWLDQVSSLKIPLTQLELVVSIGGLTAPALTNVRNYVPPHPGPRWAEVGAILLSA